MADSIPSIDTSTATERTTTPSVSVIPPSTTTSHPPTSVPPPASTIPRHITPSQPIRIPHPLDNSHSTFQASSLATASTSSPLTGKTTSDSPSRGRNRVRVNSAADVIGSPSSFPDSPQKHGERGRNASQNYRPVGELSPGSKAALIGAGDGVADGAEVQDVELAEKDAQRRRELAHPGEEEAQEKAGGRVGEGKEAGDAKGCGPPTKGTDKKEPTKLDTIVKGFKSHSLVVWVWPKLSSFEDMKPVIRCTVAAWLGLVMLLIYDVEATLGQAAFFCLIVAFIAPPNLPFIQAMEQLFFMFFFVGLSWAWVVLGAFCSDQARDNSVESSLLRINQDKYAGLAATNPSLYAREIIFRGSYIQAGPSIICAAFLGLGTAFFAWVKIRTQPAPWTFACVFACILADVSLTIIQLFPYPYYSSGLLFMLPMAVQAAIAAICSVAIFPESVNYSFTKKLIGTISPLNTAYADMLELFSEVKEKGLQPVPTDDADDGTIDLLSWSARAAAIKEIVIRSGALLGPALGQRPYLVREWSYGRLSGRDLKELFRLMQTLQLRSGGITFFFDVVEGAVKKNALDTAVYSVQKADALASRVPSPATSRPASPSRSRNSSPRGSVDHQDGMPIPSRLSSALENARLSLDTHDDAASEEGEDSSGLTMKRKHGHTRPAALQHLHAHSASRWWNLKKRHDSPSDRHSDRHGSRVSLFEHFKKAHAPVGLYESVRYMNMERSTQSDPRHISMQMTLLARSATPLIREISGSVKQVKLWLVDVNKHRSLRRFLFPQWCKPLMTQEAKDALRSQLKALKDTLDEFRDSKRLEVIEPYMHLLDPSFPAHKDVDYEHLEHRALYWDFLASYHLMEFATTLLELMEKVTELDKERPKNKIWRPRFSFTWKYFNSGSDHGGPEGDDLHNEVDADGDMPEAHMYLAKTRARDPDNVPFNTPIFNSLRWLDNLGTALTGTQCLFAVKAGILTVLVAMPAYFPGSAGFFYYNRGLWVIVMAQLTLALYSGDTISAWLVRIQASFWGCLLGMVLWYIAEGNSHSEPWGLAVVGAVTFLPLQLVRVHAPVPPLTAILFVVSTVLIMGYSWINGTLVQTTNATWGWDVAWRRFVCVLIGVTAAFIFALLPPTSSGKTSIRMSYARTVSQVGSVFCDIVSQGLSKDFDQGINTNPVRDNVLALRRKLAKLALRHASISYEISFKGQWPAARYKALHDLLQESTSLLSQLHHVLREMPVAWRRALLERTRLSDSQFLGDVLAVMNMCSTALSTGNPLPQVTPGPLIERLYLEAYGLDISHREHGDLPKHVTADVLQSMDYLRYALATTVTFSIIRRLDKLLLTTKTLVGEAFHIDLDLEEGYPLMKHHEERDLSHQD